MKQALNRFMHDNKNLTIHSADELDSIIVPVVDVVSRQLGPTAFRNRTQVNAAVFDAVMIGLASAIGKGSFIEESFKDKYASLISDQEFVQYTEQSTGMEKSVKGRIEKAINAFAI